MNTAVGTYITGVMLVIVGIFLFVRATALTSNNKVVNRGKARFIRIAGAALIGFGLLFILGEWMFGSGV